MGHSYVIFVRRNGIRQNGIRRNGLTPNWGFPNFSNRGRWETLSKSLVIVEEDCANFSATFKFTKLVMSYRQKCTIHWTTRAKTSLWVREL